MYYQYIIILESKDKSDQEVKDEKRFTLFSSKEKKVPDNKLFFINTNKTFYEIGDEVELQIGSASKNMSVFVQIEKDHKIENSIKEKTNNKVKEISINDTVELSYNYDLLTEDTKENQLIDIFDFDFSKGHDSLRL